jgi:hypothetical protein
MHIEPVPTPEEAAAIAAVLARLIGKRETEPGLREQPISRWRTALGIVGGDRKPQWGSWWR